MVSSKRNGPVFVVGWHRIADRICNSPFNNRTHSYSIRLAYAFFRKWHYWFFMGSCLLSMVSGLSRQNEKNIATRERIYREKLQSSHTSFSIALDNYSKTPQCVGIDGDVFL